MPDEERCQQKFLLGSDKFDATSLLWLVICWFVVIADFIRCDDQILTESGPNNVVI
jgi:hypothetical protein